MGKKVKKTAKKERKKLAYCMRIRQDKISLRYTQLAEFLQT